MQKNIFTQDYSSYKILSSPNFDHEVVALSAFRLQVNSCAVISDAAGVDLCIAFAFTDLIGDTDECDCSVVALAGERESDVFRYDSHERWRLVADGVAADYIIRPLTAPGRVCAGNKGCDG